MLELLRIKNFILIDEQEISFSGGLNVFTGETGAGKSIVLQALSLILGARPKPGLVKKGAEKWEIEAAFDLTSCTKKLRFPDIVSEDEEQLILYRSGGASGRSKAMINGRLATIGMLEEVARELIHICGQGAFVTLLDAKEHLAMLDSFAGLGAELQKYEEVFARYAASVSLLRDRKATLENSALRRAELEYLVAELESAGIEAGVRGELETLIESLSNAEGRILAANSIESIITDDGGLLDSVRTLHEHINSIADEAKEIVAAAEIASSLNAELSDLSMIVSRYASSIETDEAALEAQREKLSEVARLERKFHMTDGQLAELLEKSRAELEALADEESLEALEKEVLEQRSFVDELGTSLTKKRQSAARKLSKTVNAELADLNMADAKLSVAFKDCERGSRGNCSAEFEVVTNKGQDPGPLKQIASGGELSRLLLVLKKVLRDRTGVNVLVFDEVDSGVSGKVARAMGEKLKSLAQNSQVVCITHLAQVASLADAHFVVRKESDSSVQTLVERLEADMVVDEIARMLAGYDITETSRASARELLAS